MIVEARVVKAFRHTNTDRIWFVGDVFKGDAASAAQLAEMGYLDFDGRAPKGPESPELATLTVRELVDICAKERIETPAKPKKSDLIAAIAAARGLE